MVPMTIFEFTQESLADLYPEGRTFYDETDDQKDFIDKLVALDYHVTVHHAKDMDSWATVYVPVDRLKEFYDMDLVVGT
jgi:hypothetical protein